MEIKIVFKSGVETVLNLVISDKRPIMDVLKELKRWIELKQTKILDCTNQVCYIGFGEVAYIEIDKVQ